MQALDLLAVSIISISYYVVATALVDYLRRERSQKRMVDFFTVMFMPLAKLIVERIFPPTTTAPPLHYYTPTTSCKKYDDDIGHDHIVHHGFVRDDIVRDDIVHDDIVHDHIVHDDITADPKKITKGPKDTIQTASSSTTSSLSESANISRCENCDRTFALEGGNDGLTRYEAFDPNNDTCRLLPDKLCSKCTSANISRCENCDRTFAPEMENDGLTRYEAFDPNNDTWRLLPGKLCPQCAWNVASKNGKTTMRKAVVATPDHATDSTQKTNDDNKDDKE